MTNKSKGVNVVILGAGGLAREVYWVFRDSNKTASRKWKVVGFIDDNRANCGKNLCGITVLGDLRWFKKANMNELRVVCAVGSPRAKRHMVERAAQLGLEFCTVIHPNVRMSEYVSLGSGTVITAGCILTTQVQVGNHVLLNLDTTVGHDVIIEDFVNVAPGCHISGSVTLKEGTDLGTGAVVLQGITVGQWSTVGAGAVVTENVQANAVVVGVPARTIRYNEPDK